VDSQKYPVACQTRSQFHDRVENSSTGRDLRADGTLHYYIISKKIIRAQSLEFFQVKTCLLSVILVVVGEAREIHTGINPRMTIIVIKQNKRHPMIKQVPIRPKLLKTI